MAYDFALDPNTSDFLFGATHDVLGVTGPELDTQRISIRCKIPRASFAYDETGTLGSSLYLIPRNPSAQRIEEARAYVREALEDMDGVSIEAVDVRVEEDGALLIDVRFIQTSVFRQWIRRATTIPSLLNLMPMLKCHTWNRS